MKQRVEQQLAGGVAAIARHSRVWAIVGLALAIVAQRLLDLDRSLPWALALWGLAAAIFLLVFHRQRLEASAAAEDLAEETRSGKCSRWLFALVAVLGVASFPAFSGNRFTILGMTLWVAAIGLLLALSGTRPGLLAALRSGPRLLCHGGIRLSWPQLGLLGIMLLGAYLRLYRIGQIPAEMGCDLPHNYANIREVLRGAWPVFFPSYPGREGLFFYLAAPIAWVLGLSHTTIKVAAALVGVATIPAAYVLGRELYDREVGLWAAFWLSISHWHIIICRVGYRASTTPLLLTLAMVYLLRALKWGRRWHFALAGLGLGFGLYTYNAFLVVPFLVAAMLAACFLTGRGHWLRGKLPRVALLFGAALLAFVPLGRYAYEQPQSYLFRAATRITGIESPLPRDIIGTLWSNILKTLVMFNYRGDPGYAANVPYLRELSFSAAVLFLLGLAYVLWRWREGHNLVLLIALGGMVLPNTLALAFPGEVPNALRAIGALPMATIVAAVGLGLLRRHLVPSLVGWADDGPALTLAVEGSRGWQARLPLRPVGRALLAIGLVVVLGAEARATYNVYFRDYVAHLPEQNYSITLEMARVIDDFAGNGEAYIKVAPNWYDGNAVRAQLRRTDQSWHNEVGEVRPDQPPLSEAQTRFLMILHPHDAETLGALRQAFPRGTAVRRTRPDGTVAFVTFYGER